MKSLRKYLLPRLLMPSNFCLPPVEYSPGTIPIQADSFRPFPNALALPTAAIRAVAVTGPTPGISVSRCQVIALVRLHVGLHILRRHQSHFMTLFAQRPPQKVRSTTRRSHCRSRTTTED